MVKYLAAAGVIVYQAGHRVSHINKRHQRFLRAYAKTKPTRSVLKLRKLDRSM